MNAKEFQYNDVVINGFVALFVNLAILPLLIVMSFVLFKGSIVLFMLLILFLAAAILMIPRIFFSGTERSPGYGILRKVRRYLYRNRFLLGESFYELRKSSLCVPVIWI